MATRKLDDRRQQLRRGKPLDVLSMIADSPLQESFDPPEIKLALLNALERIAELEIEVAQIRSEQAEAREVKGR